MSEMDTASVRFIEEKFARYDPEEDDCGVGGVIDIWNLIDALKEAVSILMEIQNRPLLQGSCDMTIPFLKRYEGLTERYGKLNTDE